MHATNLLRNTGTAAVKTGAKRDPELYVLMGVMTAAFAGVGYYFGRNPTSSTSDESHAIPHTHTPGFGAHIHEKSPPTALHSVVIPNVNLPKELHEKYNKYGKDGF